jgi:ornithine cyclodeaminase
VVTATNSEDPFVREAWLRPGCTIYSLGGGQELDDDAYTAVDKFIVDDWEQVVLKPDMKRMLAAGAIGQANVHADLGQIVTGARTARENPAERIFVRSEGLVSIDVTLTHYLYQQAKAKGIGQRIQA